ncbi:MAG: hypothetical protein C4308_03295 [Chitinophagaceae bacterium]
MFFTLVVNKCLFVKSFIDGCKIYVLNGPVNFIIGIIMKSGVCPECKLLTVLIFYIYLLPA